MPVIPFVTEPLWGDRRYYFTSFFISCYLCDFSLQLLCFSVPKLEPTLSEHHLLPPLQLGQSVVTRGAAGNSLWALPNSLCGDIYGGRAKRRHSVEKRKKKLLAEEQSWVYKAVQTLWWSIFSPIIPWVSSSLQGSRTLCSHTDRVSYAWKLEMCRLWGGAQE